MKPLADIIIIGAGPAGLSAASKAAGFGLEVLVLDEQSAIGGQIYRNIERAGKDRIDILGKDYAQGRSVASRFRASRARYIMNALVWRIDADGSVYYLHQKKARQIRGKRILIATGGMERPVPFAGWTLPGVMGVGALDANFKSSGIIPRGPVAMAGSGPLILSAAGHLIRQGVSISAVLDTSPMTNIPHALPHVVRAFKRPDYLLKGLVMMAFLQKNRIRVIHGVKSYQALGGNKLDRVAYRTKNRSGIIEAGIFAVHEGVIPRTDFTRQAGLDHLWNPVQRYWHPKTDTFGRTSEPRIYVAGDGAFVHGGIPAGFKGELAALEIADELNVISASEKNDAAGKICRNLASELSPHPFIDAFYRPRRQLYHLSPDTLICRCEGVRARDIFQAMAQGCREPNEIKALTRCGMGPCQGRMCGTALSEIIAARLGQDSSQVPGLNIRPPVRNISLAELAGVELLEQKE